MDKGIKETVINVDHISKDFVLPHEKNSSIKTTIVNIFKNKDKGYEVQHALKDISFEVKKGEFFGILGRNGSGKSTLLKILAEIYNPTKGLINVSGKLVPFIELGVGFNPELSGRENVYLNGALLGFSRKQIEEKYDEIVKFAELENFMDQKLKNYSSGMQVRLAFSMATRAEADVLLVDEVLAVGDAAFQRKCYNYFKSLKKSGKTVIFVTHDMDAVREYCDKAILIDDGVIKVEAEAGLVADEYLKLFNDSNPEDNNGVGNTRWGNGLVKITSHKLTVDKNLRLEFSVTSDVDIDNVLIGFEIYDSDDVRLLGASTANAKTGAVNGISFKKDETKKVIFESANILSGGSYRLGYTIRLADLVTICDNDDNAAQFSYSGPENQSPIILPVQLTIKSGSAE